MVGSDKPVRVDVRIIAATNRNLEKEVSKGNFREDLYYRINVVNIELPPLRDRREDIEPLAYHLLNRVSRRQDRAVRLSNDALRAILRYDWPGNVRALRHAVERAVILSEGEAFEAWDLTLRYRLPTSSTMSANRMRLASTRWRRRFPWRWKDDFVPKAAPN